MRSFVIGLIGLVVGMTANAGIPIDEEIECAIGGEKFKIVSTMSCTYGLGPPNMLLKSYSSCDFVTRLPQCPTNGLPMYRSFDSNELEDLESYMGTSAYKSARANSKYYLAAQIEQHLAGSHNSTSHNILLHGLQEDPSLLDDDAYIDEYKTAAQHYLSNDEVDQDNAPFEQTILAYVMTQSNDAASAQALLANVRESEVFSTSEFLREYVVRVERCTEKPQADFCSWDQQVRVTEPEIE